MVAICKTCTENTRKGGGGLVLVIIIYVTWSSSLWILMICDGFLKWKKSILESELVINPQLFLSICTFWSFGLVLPHARHHSTPQNSSDSVLTECTCSGHFLFYQLCIRWDLLDLRQLNIPHFVLPQPAGAVAIAESVHFKVQTPRSVLQYFTRLCLQTVIWEASSSVLKTNSLSDPRVTWLHITEHYWKTYWGVIT